MRNVLYYWIKFIKDGWFNNLFGNALQAQSH